MEIDDPKVLGRENLRRKYLQLGTGELFAAVAFCFPALVATTRLQDKEALALWAALIPLVLILVQAGTYWLLARSWVKESQMPASTAAVYSVLRVVNVGQLIAGLVGVVAWWPSRLWVVLLLLGVWLFGVIEYVNYFQVRLSYPVSRWFSTVGQWRTPQLIKDVHSARR